MGDGERVLAAATRLRLITLFLAVAVLLPAWLVDWVEQQVPPLESSVLRIGIDPSVPPFAYYEGQDVVGFEIDIARALAAELGLEVQWMALGFDGLYDALRADAADILIASMSPDPLRTNDALYTNAYFDAGLVLVSSADDRFNHMSDISGRMLSYAFGSHAHAESDRWQRRVAPYTTLPFELPKHALDAVRMGHANAALVSSTDARLYLRQHPEWDAYLAFITQQPYVIAVNPRLRRLPEAINAALDILEADGTLAMLLRRWLY